MALDKRIVIVGGGFGGVRTALDLKKMRDPNIHVRLISDRPHLEYYGALYRILSGHNPMEVCVPLQDIFGERSRRVDVVRDRVMNVDLKEKVLTGESGCTYAYDVLVLAVGSQAAYFGIPGVEERSYGFRTVTDALKLKRHIHEVLEETHGAPPELDVPLTRVVVVGGGTTGVEVAGELAVYVRQAARRHKVDPRTLITIDLIEALPRLLPGLPESVSRRVFVRLHALGVNIHLNRTVTKETAMTLTLKDMTVKTCTVIWTAGVRGNAFLSRIPGLSVDQKGRINVDDHLRARGARDVYVIGNAAATAFSGMAQTAVADGAYVARAIVQKHAAPRIQKKPVFAIPVGPKWAVVILGPFRFTGRFGWWLRRAADLKVFLSMLPVRKALRVWRSGSKLTETCTVCSPYSPL